MSERLSPNPARLKCRSTARIVFNQVLGSIGNSTPFLGCHLVPKLRCLFRASTDDGNSFGTSRTSAAARSIVGTVSYIRQEQLPPAPGPINADARGKAVLSMRWGDR